MSAIRFLLLRCAPLIALAFGLASASAAQPAFVLLGDLPGGANESRAYGISPDGSVVVGNSDAAPGLRGFRWENGVMAALSAPASGIVAVTARDASRGGRVVVGQAQTPQGVQAYRWIEGVMTLLGPETHHAIRVSEGGKVVAGTIPADSTGPWIFDPIDNFRWESGEVTLVPGGSESNSWVSLSADGSVQGGEGIPEGGQTSSDWSQAFRWQGGVATPLEGLGGLYPTYPQLWMSGVVALSSDGASMVVAMWLWGGPPTWITRCTGQCWSFLGEVATLDHPNDYESYPADGNWDLSVIVGNHWVPGSPGVRRAMVYDDVNGIRDLQTAIENDYGLDLSQWELTRATAVSEDGNVVAGYGEHATLGTQAWLFDSDGGLSPSLPPPPPAPTPGLSQAGRALLALLVVLTAILSLVATCRYRRAG